MPMDPEMVTFLREGREDREVMRQSIEASNRVIAENRDELRAFRDESREFRKELREFREESREFREEFREAHANDRSVLVALTAQIRESIEENRRHNDAVVGALTDLAAEIRGWGGSSQN